MDAVIIIVQSVSNFLLLMMGLKYEGVFLGPELIMSALDQGLDIAVGGLMKIPATQSVITRKGESGAGCIKSRMPNIEDIMMSLVKERYILAKCFLLHFGCSGSKMYTRNSEDSETYGEGIRDV